MVNTRLDSPPLEGGEDSPSLAPDFATPVLFCISLHPLTQPFETNATFCRVTFDWTLMAQRLARALDNPLPAANNGP